MAENSEKKTSNILLFIKVFQQAMKKGNFAKKCIPRQSKGKEPPIKLND